MFLFIIESQLDKNILRLYTHLVRVTLCKGDQSMRIALCDDNEQDLNYYSDLICTLAKEKNIAIEVVRFETGEQALFHISNNEKPIDILLLDIHMPGINGIETGLKLRQAPSISMEKLFLSPSLRIMQLMRLTCRHFIILSKESPPQKKQMLF